MINLFNPEEARDILTNRVVNIPRINVLAGIKL